MIQLTMKKTLIVFRDPDQGPPSVSRTFTLPVLPPAGFAKRKDLHYVNPGGENEPRSGSQT